MDGTISSASVCLPDGNNRDAGSSFTTWAKVDEEKYEEEGRRDGVHDRKIIWEIDASPFSVRGAKALWERRLHASDSSTASTAQTSLLSCSATTPASGVTTSPESFSECLAKEHLPRGNLLHASEKHSLYDDEGNAVHETTLYDDEGNAIKAIKATVNFVPEENIRGSENRRGHTHNSAALREWSGIIENKKLDKADVIRQWTRRRISGNGSATDTANLNRFNTRHKYGREMNKTQATKAAKPIMPWIDQLELVEQEDARDEEEVVESKTCEGPPGVNKRVKTEDAVDEGMMIRYWNGGNASVSPLTRPSRNIRERLEDCSPQHSTLAEF